MTKPHPRFPVYVDTMEYPKGKIWIYSRMWCEDEATLHKMAETIKLTKIEKECFFWPKGKNPHGFPYPEYTIVSTWQKQRALDAGAIEVDKYEYFLIAARENWDTEKEKELLLKRYQDNLSAGW